MFKYIVRGLQVPLTVHTFELHELFAVRELLVQLEVTDSHLKRRLLMRRICVILKSLGKLPEGSNLTGLSIGWLANGEKRVFAATYPHHQEEQL